MPKALHDGKIIYHCSNVDLLKCDCGCELYKLINKDDDGNILVVISFKYDKWTEIYMKMIEVESLGKIRT